MALEAPGEIARQLASRGYNADREAVALVASAPDPDAALDAVLDAVDDDALVVTAADVETALEWRGHGGDGPPGDDVTSSPSSAASRSPDETMGVDDREPPADDGGHPGEPRGDTRGEGASSGRVTETAVAGRESAADTDREEPSTDVTRDPTPAQIAGEVTGESTCTGEYGDFVSLFRDRYERLSATLRGRVDHRPVDSIEGLPGGTDVGLIGLVNDVRSTSGGHRLVELEDTTGAFPCLVTTDRDVGVEELVVDEVVAVEGTLADDGGVVFVDDLRFPDVPRRHSATTADREVSAALVSDVHVGSNEFAAEAWDRFARWLHTPDAADVEYLLVAGDMVEGVGVYPGQDEDLAIVDIYEQYEAFAERLKDVPGDLEIVMIPGNHDAVRLAEPQPGFREDLRDIMSAHDARIVGNPSTVTVEGVSVLMYHGTSLDELIAHLPDASYDAPARAMTHLLKKRHLAPSYGGRTQIAPERRDYLVVDEVPDVLHGGHVHTVGVTTYHGVTVVNSGCWQSQTDFQRRNNIDPDYGYAPILDLSTLEVTLRKFV
ncbi:MAG: DNA-directed DNA polymerase II small subunit [Halobacteriaceae archaeon]